MIHFVYEAVRSLFTNVQLAKDSYKHQKLELNGVQCSCLCVQLVMIRWLMM